MSGIEDDDEYVRDEPDRVVYDAADLRYWAQVYGDIVAVESLGIAERLHGARLAAGIVYTTEAARLLEMPNSTYNHAEEGLRPVNDELVEKAAELFGVSKEYLIDGEPSSGVEILADRLAAILETVEVDELETYDSYFPIVERLREMRVAAGHESAGAAAGAYGWNKSTYWQHEAGTRGITIDRLIAYSLAMGARPEWSVTGEGELREPVALGWTEKERVGSTSRPFPRMIR